MARNQKIMNINTIKECFDTVLSGDKNSSRLATRRVRKLLYSSQSDRDKFEDIKSVINSTSDKYAKIEEYCGQEYLNRFFYLA